MLSSRLSLSNSNSSVFFAAGVFGVILGLIWDGPFYLIGVLFLFPILWYVFRPYESFFFVFMYYLVSTKSIPLIFSNYYQLHSTLIYSKYILLWMIYSLFLSIPWLIVKIILIKHDYKKHKFLKLKESFFILIPLISSVFPPLYFIGVGSPLEASGVLFPGLKLYGICLFFSLILLIISMIKSVNIVNHKKYLMNYLFLVIIITTSISCNIIYKAPKTPKKWIAISTEFPKEINNKNENFIRYIILVTSIKSIIDKGYKVLIFPENAIGLWNNNRKKLWDGIANYAKNRRAIILSGAFIQFDEKKYSKINSGIIAFGKQNGVIYLTRQPVPISEWIPFSSKGITAHWFSKGINVISDVKVSFLVCYEELLPGLIITSFLSFQEPKMIISVVNNWMGSGTGERRSQFNSLFVMARLFGVPFLRSWNR